MSISGEERDAILYNVVVNDEEQYSIWPANKPNAPGWRAVGKSGSKEACLSYIAEVWTDMRPLSLRKAMSSTTPRTTGF